MSLSKATATKIVEVVSADADSRAAMGSNSFWEDARLAGFMRNLGYIFTNKTFGDPSVQKYLCTGVTYATMEAIAKAGVTRAKKEKREPKIAEVESAGSINREAGYLNVHHTATRVFMVDGSDYVFDWHETLNAGNPIIYKVADWKQAVKGYTYVSFRGYDPDMAPFIEPPIAKPGYKT